VTRALRVAVFAALSAAGTMLVGWWLLPLLAVGWVRVLPSTRNPVRTTALGAALGWAALLGWGALHGPLPALAVRMSALLQLPRWGFVLATLLYPALLAGAAALMVKPAEQR
jgi:hypothetical protein